MQDLISRRTVLRTISAAAISSGPSILRGAGWMQTAKPLAEFRYDQVSVSGATQVSQRDNVTQVLLDLDPDNLMKPYRAMAGKPAPGAGLGGWYEWKADYDHHHDDSGLAPGSTLGQWISAMGRLSAGDPLRRQALAARVADLVKSLGQDISAEFFAQTRFPAYTLDKLVCGMVDAHRILQNRQAFPTLDRVMDAAAPSLPNHAVDREVQWKPGADISWMWDESYTLPENLLLAADHGADPRYRKAAESYLADKTYFAPLAQGKNMLADKHAYSYINALCSATQMHLSTGSPMHLQAAVNGFDFLQQQSFSTGGWGPDELLRKPGYDDLFKSLTSSHNAFETPCGSYAHAKLTRALLRATRDGGYGDSMERVLFNTTMGVLPLQADGRSFYNADYNTIAKRTYSVHRWPCCSGTLPQVVADYGINSYLQEPDAIWINLYQPSEVRWKMGEADLVLTQQHDYPRTDKVSLRLNASRPVSFALRVRIPAWTTNPSLTVNGIAQPLRITKGFASVERLWRNGDTVSLILPMALRLETLPSNGMPHPDIVPLVHGPLVLFALRQPSENGPLQFRRDDLLDATRTGPAEWTVTTSMGPRRFVPFTDVGDTAYTTYFNMT